MNRQAIGIASFFGAATFGWLVVSINAQPAIRNANLRTESASPALASKIGALNRDAGPLWVGYEVPAIRPARRHSWGGCGIQYLEDGNHHSVETSSEAALPGTAFILLRLANHAIGKIAVADQGCQVDAGGLPVVWLTGVKQEESVAFLRRFAETDANEGALLAIGVHETSSATRALAELASPKQPLHFREKASFWLATERGPEGLPALEQLARDADPRFREKMAFHFTLVSDPRAIDELIRMAKDDTDSKVRSQAMFWLAQKAGAKAVSFLSAAAQNDPEMEVKKKAVFALSQLPKDEGIPQLIHVAETNGDREVRKQAIFWLGQSGDPRALKYLEQLLSR